MALHKQVHEDESDTELDINPVYFREKSCEIPRYRLPEHGVLPRTALQVVRDELILDGNARLNLATFVTTWMEPEAEQLMAECSPKNMIDKDEYPQTAELEHRCVNILGHLWNAPHERGGRLLDHRVERGVHARRHGAAVAVARPAPRRRPGHRPAEPGHGHATSRSAGRSSAGTGTSSRSTCRWCRAATTWAPPEAAALCDENTIGVVGDHGLDDGRLATSRSRELNAALDALAATPAGPTCRSTSTPRPAGSSRRSCSRTSSGTSGCRGSPRSTPPGTSTAWSTPASAGSSGATRSTCPRT